MLVNPIAYKIFNIIIKTIFKVVIKNKYRWYNFNYHLYNKILIENTKLIEEETTEKDEKKDSDIIFKLRKSYIFNKVYKKIYEKLEIPANEVTYIGYSFTSRLAKNNIKLKYDFKIINIDSDDCAPCIYVYARNKDIPKIKLMGIFGE